MLTSSVQYYAFDCAVIYQNANNTAAGWDAIISPTPGLGSGIVGAQTLASLYSQDTTNHYAQYTTGNVYADGTPANDGTWLKTGTGNGSGNWTQVSTVTLASVCRDRHQRSRARRGFGSGYHRHDRRDRPVSVGRRRRRLPVGRVR